jgi:hypothetical protein
LAGFAAEEEEVAVASDTQEVGLAVAGEVTGRWVA